MTALEAPAVRAGDYSAAASEAEARPGSLRELREAEEETLAPEALRARVGNLRDALARVVEEREGARGRATVAAQHHREDIEAIGARLLAEAEERGWCGDYDDIVSDVNRRLHIELPTRYRLYRVEVPVTVVVPVYVSATDEDSAIEDAREEHGSHLTEEAVEAIRSGYSLDVCWSDASAEEGE